MLDRENQWIYVFPKSICTKGKINNFELDSPILFCILIAITPNILMVDVGNGGQVLNKRGLSTIIKYILKYL